MSDFELGNGVRRAAVGLWVVGAGFAAVAGFLGAVNGEAGFAVVYALIAAGLAAMAVATHQGRGAAQVVTLVLLGSQLIGVVGAAWELFEGDDDNAKARHLHDLGVNYRLALALNLAYSLAASAVFLRAVADLRRRHGVRTG